MKNLASERGITLIELIVYIALSTVILAIVGGLLINSLTAENLVRDSGQANTDGQLVAQSVSKSTRLARDLDVQTPTPDTMVLRALIVDDALSTPIAAHCEAWYFGDNQIRTTRSGSAIAVPTDPADVAGWTLLASGVRPVGANPIFDVTGLSVSLKIQLDSGDSRPVLIETTAVSRQPATPPTEVESLCF